MDYSVMRMKFAVQTRKRLDAIAKISLAPAPGVYSTVTKSTSNHIFVLELTSMYDPERYGDANSELCNRSSHSCVHLNHQKYLKPSGSRSRPVFHHDQDGIYTIYKSLSLNMQNKLSSHNSIIDSIANS